MKTQLHKTHRLLILLAGLVLSQTAIQPVVAQAPIANEALHESYAQRTDSWWALFSESLVSSLNRPNEQGLEVTLQNLIFFGTHYKAHLDVDLAVGRLLQLSRTHQSENVRIMAIVALHALNNPFGMELLPAVVQQESDHLVRRIGLAAVAEYRRENR